MSLLQVRDVNFAYGADAPVLRHVSLDLDAGMSALVLGDNGSGKSTLGRLIGGLASPTTGTIEVGGESVSRLRARARPSRTIYVSQVSYLQFFRPSIAEELALAARQSGHAPPTEDVVSCFRLPALSTNPRDLTYPEMWRLQLLLLGVVFQPAVMFIDEIVAPGAAGQREALEFVMARRRRQGQVTLLAYQRTLDTVFDAVFRVEGTTVTAVPPGGNL